MPITTWPTPANALALLPTSISSGIPAVESDYVVDAVVAEFENATGWRPFMSTGVDEARILSAPDYRTGRSVLKLTQGAVSVTEVEVDLNDSGVGTVLVAETEYNLEPTGADDDNKPFTRIVFGRFGPDFSGTSLIVNANYARTSAFAGKVRVTAKWGYCLVPPADAYLAVLHKAASMLLAGSRARLTGGINSWTEADIKEDWGGSNNPVDSTMSAWDREFATVVAKYQRFDK